MNCMDRYVCVNSLIRILYSLQMHSITLSVGSSTMINCMNSRHTNTHTVSYGKQNKCTLILRVQPSGKL